MRRVGNRRGNKYVTGREIQNPDIQKLLGQAIVNCITGNRIECARLCELAAGRQSAERNKSRLHASIGSILKSKGREVTFIICH